MHFDHIHDKCECIWPCNNPIYPYFRGAGNGRSFLKHLPTLTLTPHHSHTFTFNHGHLSNQQRRLCNDSLATAGVLVAKDGKLCAIPLQKCNHRYNKVSDTRSPQAWVGDFSHFKPCFVPDPLRHQNEASLRNLCSLVDTECMVTWSTSLLGRFNFFFC